MAQNDHPSMFSPSHASVVASMPLMVCLHAFYELCRAIFCVCIQCLYERCLPVALSLALTYLFSMQSDGNCEVDSMQFGVGTQRRQLCCSNHF